VAWYPWWEGAARGSRAALERRLGPRLTREGSFATAAAAGAAAASVAAADAADAAAEAAKRKSGGDGEEVAGAPEQLKAVASMSKRRFSLAAAGNAILFASDLSASATASAVAQAALLPHASGNWDTDAASASAVAMAAAAAAVGAALDARVEAVAAPLDPQLDTDRILADFEARHGELQRQLHDAATRRAAALRGTLEARRAAAMKSLAGIMAETGVAAAAFGAIDRAAGAAAEVAGKFPGADPVLVAEAAETSATEQRGVIAARLQDLASATAGDPQSEGTVVVPVLPARDVDDAVAAVFAAVFAAAATGTDAKDGGDDSAIAGALVASQSAAMDRRLGEEQRAAAGALAQAYAAAAARGGVTFLSPERAATAAVAAAAEAAAAEAIGAAAAAAAEAEAAGVAAEAEVESIARAYASVDTACVSGGNAAIEAALHSARAAAADALAAGNAAIDSAEATAAARDDGADWAGDIAAARASYQRQVEVITAKIDAVAAAHRARVAERVAAAQRKREISDALAAKLAAKSTKEKLKEVKSKFMQVPRP